MSLIQPIPEEDIDRFLDIVYNAYPIFRVVTDEDKRRARERFDRRSEDPRVSLYGLYRDGELLGGLRLHDYRMNLFGSKILAGGGGFLAVSLLHKKQHVAKELMQFYFRHYRKQGAPLAVLWPFRPDFYRKMGCGYGSKSYQYQVKPVQLPKKNPTEHIRFLSRGDLSELSACYNRVADRTHGMIEETVRSWEITYDTYKDQKYIGYEEDGKIRGYLIFSFKRGKESNFLDNYINVSEMVYEKPEVLAEFMTFLQTQADQISCIIINTHDENFHHLLEDPRSIHENILSPVYHESHIAGVGLMYRVLDVPMLFEKLRDRDFNGKNLQLKLHVIDTFLPENDGSIVIHFIEGKPQLDNSGMSEIEVHIDIADFTSLVLGTIDFSSLCAYNRIQISNPIYVDRLNTLFAVERKPVCLTMF